MAATNCFTVSVEAAPMTPPPPTPVKTIPKRILAILMKYKFSWRINQLSKPMRPRKKYISKEIGKPLKYDKSKGPQLDDETKFYSDQLATPALKNLIANRKLYSKIDEKLDKKLEKNLTKAWGSIYNYYRKRERDKRLRQLKKEREKAKGKEKPKVFERTSQLAKPKKMYVPPAPKRKKIFDSYDRLDTLASPKVYVIKPPRQVGVVNPHALTYEPTEIVFRLAKLPERFKNLPKPLEPGAVKRSALRYKVTPRIEALCVPKRTREKTKEDDDVDPWAISKNALKYKATPRILDLAKPRE